MPFVLRRLLRLVPVLLVVSATAFLLLNLLPGDVSTALLGGNATPAAVAQVRADLGLDRPIYLRYASWLASALAGDLGRSYITGIPVLQQILERLPVTLELMALSIGFALSLALVTAIAASFRPGGAIDRILGAAALMLLGMPAFITAIILMFVFALTLRWLPSTGFEPVAAGLGGNLAHMALPALAIGLTEWPPLHGVLRADLLQTLSQDFIALAKAKGLAPLEILVRHALRPSSFTLVTVLGLQVGAAIAGALVAETIFALPGVGRLLTGAVYNRDLMIVQGAVAVISVGYVL
ncbi:MAG: ABC transporter permease, partial [Caulobacteraceae bacterium]|nr:ABC transporter permease [Caulobacteraceae bacterium]